MRTVSWDIANIRSELEQSTNDGSTWTSVALSNPEATSKSFSNMGNGTYHYRVRSCNEVSCSTESNVDSVTVLRPPSSLPSLTAPGSDNNGAYSVSWTSVATATTYQLQRKLNSGSYGTIQNTSALSRSESGLSNGTYTYRVRACNNSGCSASYSATKATVVTHPPASAPTLTVPSPTTAGQSFTVSWTSVSTATSYQLQRRKVGYSWATVYNSSGTSYANTLSSGQYEYRVRACNVGGCSSYSAIKSTGVATGGGSCSPFLGCDDPYFTDPGGDPAEMSAPQTMEGSSEPQPATEPTDGEGI